MTASLHAPANPSLTGAGLTSSECYEIAIAARCLPGLWDVQWDRDDQGHVSIALLEEVTATDIASVFLIWREDGRLQLGVGDDDRYGGLGTHADVGSIMSAVRRAVVGVAAH